MAFPPKTAKPNPFAPAEAAAPPQGNKPFPAKKKAKGKGKPSKKDAAPGQVGLNMAGLRRYQG